MEERSNKPWIVGVIAIVFVVAVVLIGAVVIKNYEPPTVSPLMAISVARCCDWVSLDNSTTYAVCADNTKWRVVLEEIPVAAWSLAPAPEEIDDSTRDTEWITVSADDDHSPPKESPVIEEGYLQDIRYSNYWPPLCGVNCFKCVNGICVSKTTSGARWEDWVNKGVACPKKWDFGTTVMLDGKAWTCVDHGGKIKFVEGIPWVDFMVANEAYPYGTILSVRVIQ